MNSKQWEELNNHIKNKFKNIDSIQELKSFPTDKQTEKNVIDINDNKIFKLKYTCIFVDIRNSSEALEKYGEREWALILSEFAYGISKIMKIYDAKYVSIQGDGIFGVFEAMNKNNINNSFDCAVDINTFKRHLNKCIKKYLIRDNSISNLEYGIGVWFSFNNFISKVGHKNSRDIVFMGDSVNYSSYLSKIAKKDLDYSILLNELTYSNFSNEYLNNNREIFEKTNSSISNEQIYGSDAIFVNYLNWINNNV